MENYCKISGGANTASKQAHRYPESYPRRLSCADGAYLFDMAGNPYLDMVCSLGAITLGYKYPEVDRAVAKTIRESGTIFTLPHYMEFELADILCNLIPCAEMVRLLHNGKDATEAAVRLARHVAGREKILSFSYHGASDVFMASTGADKGVPKCLKDTIIDIPYNDIEIVKKLFDKHEIAAIILEPHTIVPPKDGYLQFLRDICTQKKALLIFDEVVTFPRYPKLSAQAFFGVIPDLTCVSKGMANGYPISALVGKEKYMKELDDGRVFVSTTFGGNLIGVSAAIATLKEIFNKNVPDYMAKLGSALVIKDNPHVRLVGYPWRRFLECSNENLQKIWQEMIKEGVFLGVPILFNFSMTITEMNTLSDNLNIIIRKLSKIKLEGNPIKEVFRKK